jgi:phage host-nuclease inhibitor protein Gam
MRYYWLHSFLVLYFQEETKKAITELNGCKNELENYEQMATQQREQMAKIEDQYQKHISELKEHLTTLQQKYIDHEQRYNVY